MARAPVKTPETDEALMVRVQDAGDIDAFGSLYDRHAARAFGVAVSVLGDSGRAEEAVQEAFLSIWRGRTNFRPATGSFRAWSMRSVRHAAIDRLRYDAATSRPVLCEQSEDPPDSSAGSVEDEVVARSEAVALRRALAELPDAQSEVITLAFYGELSHAEIADQLELPPGTVKGRMRLGLEKLRTQSSE